MSSSNKKKTIGETDEVEQLLQSAQDEVLLKLSVNSHIAHLSSNDLDSDLDRRFQALKSRPSVPQSSSLSTSSTKTTITTPPSQSQSQSINHVIVDDELRSVLGDDLSARFAALKASSSSSNSDTINNEVGVGPKISVDDDYDEEDEVEKLIRWAKDAARLDPTPSSDDDKDSNCDDSYDDKDSDDDVPPQKNGHRK